MKQLDQMAEGGYPFDDVSINYLQQMHNERDAFIAAIIGDKKIIKGVVYSSDSNSYSDGLIVIADKLYHFVGGSAQTTISKQTIVTKRQYKDGLEKEAFINEFYEFGDAGTDAIAFNELKPVDNLYDLLSNELIKNVQPDWNISDSDSLSFIKNKPTLVKSRVYGKIIIGTVPPPITLSVTGGLTSATRLNSDGFDSRIRVNFPSVGTADYVPIIALESKNSDYRKDNDVILSVKNITATSFEILLAEQTGEDQNVNIIVQIIV